MPDLTVTKPFLPALQDYAGLLSGIWERNILTNNGPLLAQLEQRLSQLLEVPYLSLVNNGTIALYLALKAYGLKGEVITTPYSFVATAHAILLAGLTPVFVDIDENSFNLDTSLLERAITEHTCAILPVHVYGNPCPQHSLASFAGYYGIKVIYDAAHATGVRCDNESVLNWGDASVLSFHATKVYHTVEGGGVVSGDPEYMERVNQLRNFGFEQDGDIRQCGINGKMNELQAAMGLILTQHLEDMIAARKQCYMQYQHILSGVEGIRMLSFDHAISPNYSYFPIVLEDAFPLTRDELAARMAEQGILARKYFHPLITDFSAYKQYPVISHTARSKAKHISERVLCLPLYPGLCESDQLRVCDIILAAGMRKIT